jgi:cell division protein FtsB
MALVELRRRSRQAIGPFLGLTAMAYFAYHMIQGDRGLIAWWRLSHEIAQAETNLAGLKSEEDRLDRRARLLRPDHLDRDMLEERARLMLDVGRPDEIMVLRPRS